MLSTESFFKVLNQGYLTTFHTRHQYRLVKLCLAYHLCLSWMYLYKPIIQWKFPNLLTMIALHNEKFTGSICDPVKRLVMTLGTSACGKQPFFISENKVFTIIRSAFSMYNPALICHQYNHGTSFLVLLK